MKIVVASSNAHKLREIAQILPEAELVPMRALGFDGEIDETGATFEENALIKARFISEKFNMPALADDSGLCVDALGGAPGVYSARYSGKGESGNRKLLLSNLAGVKNRAARFECVVCLRFPDGKTVFGKGEAKGEILLEETGDGGFGYDPLFYSYDLKKSFASASAEEKNAVSHRCRALNDLKSKI